MNGRCETDPLDRAVDVCDSCFGEFCDNCLLRPKGRRHPVCTECALIASGVRRPAEPRVLGAKRTAKKRRTALKKHDGEETPVFEYFDAGEPLDAAEAPAEGKKRKKSDTSVTDEPVDAEPEDELAEVESHQAAGGLQLKIEQASALDPEAEIVEQAAPAPETTAATTDDEIAGDEVPGDEIAGAEIDADAETAESAETSETPDGAEASEDGAAESEEASATTSTSAIKKLAELRKRSSDPDPEPTPEATGAAPQDAAPEAEPTAQPEPTVATSEPEAPAPTPEPAVASTEPTAATSEPGESVAAAAATSSPEAQVADEAVDAADPDQSGSSTPDDRADDASETVAARRSARPTPRPVAARPQPERPAVSYPGTERRRRKTDGPGDVERPKTTAPMIGEVRTIGSRRSTDVPEPEAPAADLGAAGFDEATGQPASADGAHNAIAEFDAGQPGTDGPAQPTQTERRADPATDRADAAPAEGPSALVNAGKPAGSAPGKADTDAEGNWIPPILRGMAPNVREAKAELPKRNRDDGED